MKTWFVEGCGLLQGCWGQGETPQEALQDFNEAVFTFQQLNVADGTWPRLSLTTATR